MFKLPFRSPIAKRLTTIQSVSLFSTIFGTTSTTQKMSEAQTPTMVRSSYIPQDPNGPFPYTAQDMTPMDPGNDASFYGPPRFVTHIDDNAIISLKRYYDDNLPKVEGGGKVVVLDFCSSWISHYPPRIFNSALKREEHRPKGEVVRQQQSENESETSSTTPADGRPKDEFIILGTGMNKAELAANPVLNAYTVQDLNEDPNVRLPAITTDTASTTAADESSSTKLTASTCVVSIDYLTSPVDVLSSIRRQTVPGGTVHLAISNRCFPTKVVGRWLQISEQERLEMVGDYLWWAGWRDVEIVEVVKKGWITDPLWVVRATNAEGV